MCSKLQHSKLKLHVYTSLFTYIAFVYDVLMDHFSHDLYIIMMLFMLCNNLMNAIECCRNMPQSKNKFTVKTK